MQRRTVTVLMSILCVVISALIALSSWLFMERKKANERLNDLSEDLAKANAHIDTQSMSIEELEGELEKLTNDLTEKMAEIEQLEGEIDILLDADAASDKYQEVLMNRISALRAEVDETKVELEALQLLIQNYKNITTLDFGNQAKKISELLMFLAQENRPKHVISTEITDEDTGEVIRTEREEVDSAFAFYYKDLATGYTLSYNASESMYAASLVKVPYVYFILSTVTEFEENKRNFDSEGNPLYDEVGKPLFKGQHPNLDKKGNIIYSPGEEKYDLSRVWTFDKETMMREGSGKLQEMEDGTKLTYLQLIEYVLLYSDNVAFNQLCQLYGYADYYAFARKLGIKGVSNGLMYLSAEEFGTFLEEVYAFTEENKAYGSVMKQAMIDSNYAVLIPYCVSPTVAAHKYGWDVDAYHDMAIVYDEHPYILVIMTDLDTGGQTVNTYVQKVIRMLHSIHEKFYEGVENEMPDLSLETE